MAQFIDSEFTELDEFAAETDITVLVPTHQDGDQMYLFLACNNGGVPDPVPTGWTHLGQPLVDAQATVFRGNWYFREADTEPADYTITWDNGAQTLGCAAILVFRGTDVPGSTPTARSTAAANDNDGHADLDLAEGVTPLVTTLVLYMGIAHMQGNRYSALTWDLDPAITLVGEAVVTNSLSTPPDNIVGSMVIGYHFVTAAVGEPAVATNLDWVTFGNLYKLTYGLAQMFDVTFTPEGVATFSLVYNKVARPVAPKKLPHTIHVDMLGG